MLQFLHEDDNDDAKAIAIPSVLYENSRAKIWSSLKFCGL